jgi:uridine kinase
MAKDPRLPALARLRVIPLAELAARVRAAPARCGGTRLVCIDGPSAAGKTELAGFLSGFLGDPPVVHMDDLYEGWDGLEAGVSRLRTEIVRPLLTGRPAAYHRYDWHADAYSPTPVELGRPELLVVEGVGSGAVAEFASLTIWIEAPERLRHHRGMARDGGAYRPHWERWAAQERAHFAEHGTRARADVEVDGAATVRHDRATEVVLG